MCKKIKKQEGKMKKELTFCLLIIVLFMVNTVFAYTVDGYAYLQNQSDHSGIEVEFERTAPDSWTGTVYTNSSGYYTINVDFGAYDITYTKDGYFYEVVNDKLINSNMTLDDVTLIEHPTLINVPALFSTIQEAINQSSNGDTILVQPGTYVENINFNGKNVIIASKYLTTLDTSYISQTIIDGNQNGSVVKFENGENSTAELIGFTVTNGECAYPLPGFGGGIYYNSSSPTLSNLIVKNNSAYQHGGGIYCTHSNSILNNITISSNSSDDAGGGIYCYNSSPTFESVTITNNSATYGHAGGIMFNNSSSTLLNVNITNNNGGMGGGISCFQSNLILENVILKNNTVYWGTGSLGCGGGIYFCDNSNKNINMRNVMITDNSANGLGGGILCHESNPVIANSTISGNNATDGGGIYCRENSIPNINNSIVANNTGNYGIYVGSGNPTIKYSDFWNNESGNFYGCSAWIGVNVMTNFNGDDCDMYYNIQMDPLFVDPDNGNYHLQSNSPCIGAGDPDTDISDYENDLDGNYRIRDAVIDMGAYEYQIGGVTIQNTIADNNTDATEFTDAGTELQFTGTHIETIVNATKYSSDPGIVGNLPSGIENISIDRYWNLYSTEGDVGNYNVTFDLSGVPGIQNFNTLHILKRDDSSSEWQDVVSDLGLTLTYNNPYITVNNLTDFSDFGIGGGSDNKLPVELLSFSSVYSTNESGYEFVTINWSTASETDVIGFNIYRSQENDFNISELINDEIIPGTNTTSTHNYTYNDEEIFNEEMQAGDIYWYWLETVELGGNSYVYEEPSQLIIPEDYEPIIPPDLPIIYGLYQNCPNPFNPTYSASTKIFFNIHNSSQVKINVYNIKGQLVKCIYNDHAEFDDNNPRPKVAYWDGCDVNGKQQKSGIYFYRMIVNGNEEEIKKLLLIR